MATLELAKYKIRRIDRGELGYLVVGFTSSIANGILPDILQTFKNNWPDVKLILQEETSAVQIGMLRNRQADIVFVYQDRQIIFFSRDY